jgi:hypothetical protein
MRKSKRIAALSVNTTPLSVASPACTSARESVVPETPVTSLDSDEETNYASAVQTRRKANNLAKRSVSAVNIMTTQRTLHDP